MTSARTGLPPAAPAAGDLEYVGFWPRVGATLIDTACVLVLVGPLTVAVYGWGHFSPSGLAASMRGPLRPVDVLISYVLPAGFVLAFWARKLATPGKLLIHARIVDARTGVAPSLRQLVVRYVGYFLAGIPLGAGLFWVAIDHRKQGWHDKLAGTVVVRTRA